jgi:hypothetical protein
MATIKLDHIELLIGSSNFEGWKRGISQVLQGEGYWGHVEGDADIYSAFPIEAPPATPTVISTPAEIMEYREWWKADSKARTIVERRITPVTLALLPQGVTVTARSVWETLKTLYSRRDVMSQFELRDRLSNAKLKDHRDLDRYIGEFKTGRLRFIEMGIPYSEYYMVHSIILRGLPNTGSWTHFSMLVTQNTQDFIDSQSHAVVKAAPDTLLDRIVSRLVIECQRIEASKPAGKSGANSEYCNHAGSSNDGVIHKHEKNPDGVICSNCQKKSHDAAHCFAKGGGMEGQGPKSKGKAKAKTELTAVVAATSTPAPASTSPDTSPPPAYAGDLSCAAIDGPSVEEMTALLAAGNSSAHCLDSGTSSHLFKDRNVFWTYEVTQARAMRTANHGVLQTEASGDCLVRFTLRLKGVTTTVKLRDCLHAPSACINLLSVGRMTGVGSKVGCVFDDGKFRIVKKNSDGTRVDIYEGVQTNNKLYFVDLEFVLPPRPVETALFTKVTETMDLWHHHMGHIGETATRNLLKSVKGVKFPLGDKLLKCEPCIIGKHTRAPHPSSLTHKSTQLLELVHCDLCGPFPVLTPHGKQYLIAFLEDSANILKVYCLARKDQSADAFQVMRMNWERKTGKKILRFRVDGAGELASNAFVGVLEGMGIERDVVPRYEHWQNGKMERVFRTLQGRMLAMLTAAQLPLTYWGEAALTAGFLFNLTTSSTLPNGITPFEILKTTKPDVSHLRTWGVRCFAHVPVELQTKLGSKSMECLFMGYPPGGRGYRVRSLTTNHFFDSGNVIFDENIPYHALHEVSSMPVDYSSLPFPTTTVLDADSPVTSLPPSSPPTSTSTAVTAPSVPDPASSVSPTSVVIPSVPASNLRVTRKLTEGGRSYAESIESAKKHLEKLRENREKRRELRNSSRALLTTRVDDDDVSDDECRNECTFACIRREGVLQDFPDSFSETDDFTASVASLDVHAYLQRDADAFVESALLSLRSDVPRNPSSPGYDMTVPPANHREAMLRSDAEEWRRVEEKELGMLKSMGVYVDEVLPEGRKAIGNRWVFEFKIDPDGGPAIAKARLVAQGFSQIPFVDYDATFAPVAKSVSVRFVAVYSALNGWHLECFDATRAFLWGDLTRTIYMRYPPGYISASGLDGVWRLLKSLYGLKQASLIWYRLLRRVLEALGFLRSEFDHAVFIFKRPWGGEDVHCLMAMHVDDGLAGCTSMKFLVFIKDEIRKAFGIKDLGPLRNFLGVQFKRNKETCELWIHQESFIDSLLAEYDLTDCNPVRTPLDNDHPLGLPTDIHAPVANLTRTFQRIVGSLLFLQICSRPDISFAVLTLSQHCASPELRHLAAAKRVLRYLKGTRSYRLHYGGGSHLLPLSGLSDADWAGDKTDRASVSGFVWSLGGGPISWSAKKQNCIALSTMTTEAEYVALTRAIQEGIWLRQSIQQFQITCPTPLIVSTDNNGAKSLSANNSNHGKAKHIDIRYHFIRSHVESKLFIVNHTPGIINTADLFTKALSRVTFQSHVARLRLSAR